MKITKEDVLSNVIDDAIRFGAAISSWVKSDIPWHKHAATECVRVIREAALREIKSKHESLDNNICPWCKQKQQ